MRASRRLGALAVLAIGAIALGAGCGGDDDGDGALSADEFRSQADAICASFDERSDELDDPTSADEVLPFLQQNVDLQREQLDELQALTPPDDLADTWNEALDLLEVQLGQVDEIIDDIEGGADPAEAVNEAGEQFEENSDRLRDLADELGLEECGSDGGSSSDDGATDTDTTGDDTLDTTAEADTIGDDTSAPTETGSISTYIEDVTDAAQALVAFGTILQDVSSPSELQAQASAAQAEVDKFDAAIQEMSTYTLDNARLEQQRAGLVESGEGVSDSLNEFIAAAEEGDVERVQELVPEVTQALSDFQSAATAGSTP